MKKIKSLLVILLIMLIAFPFGVKAEEEKNEETKKEPVKVYLFRSNTCGYCEAALEWFNSIEEEYGEYFDLIDYEVSSSENSLLWEEVATTMGDTPSGVPYMVVGEYSYPNGFAADTQISSTSDETNDRYDVMVELNNKPDYSNIVTVVALVIIVGFGAMAIITRRRSR